MGRSNMISIIPDDIYPQKRLPHTSQPQVTHTAYFHLVHNTFYLGYQFFVLLLIRPQTH